MQALIGTSGFSYKEWKGSFYPAKLPASGMLRYYGERFPTVEINSTFYRMPTEAALARWPAEVPPGFSFAIKANQRITHERRLKPEAAEALAYQLRTIAVLGAALGPVLFQLPPNFKKDVPRLAAFLALVPAGTRAAFEFRHESWLSDDVYQALRAAGAALCVADAEDLRTPLVATAPFGYLRLRDAGYGDAELAAWADKIRAQPWERAHVFFKHEEQGKGPELAARLSALLGDPARPAGRG